VKANVAMVVILGASVLLHGVWNLFRWRARAAESAADSSAAEANESPEDQEPLRMLHRGHVRMQYLALGEIALGGLLLARWLA